ncbi:Tigger transposable element-derived protein 4 [Araneus ventricosus]|uniref:Tigger transposable element-derived protein 4 n=1 Tax=Araneus ventricosus TaxID=182803 RepID=A0A4Y2AFU0_ARAVE|nr:Tigger transposable element-derived protein 4 [Araneus ventricosus]
MVRKNSRHWSLADKKNPRCFKNVKKLSCDYTSNKTVCMTSHIFLDFLHKFDRKMEKEKRKVLLFVDQCSAHPQDLPTTRKLCFFLRIARVIRCVKVYYRKTLIRRLLAASVTKRAMKDELKQVTVLDAIHMLCSSWRNITEKCIKCCFKKAGFSFPAETEYEEPENENDINEEDWHTVSGGLAMHTFNNEFVDADENLITAQLREIGDIAAEINGCEEDEEEDNDDEDRDEIGKKAEIICEQKNLHHNLNVKDVLRSKISGHAT